jgi:hypothetical protein
MELEQVKVKLELDNESLIKLEAVVIELINTQAALWDSSKLLTLRIQRASDYNGKALKLLSDLFQ